MNIKKARDAEIIRLLLDQRDKLVHEKNRRKYDITNLADRQKVTKKLIAKYNDMLYELGHRNGKL